MASNLIYVCVHNYVYKYIKKTNEMPLNIHARIQA